MKLKSITEDELRILLTKYVLGDIKLKEEDEKKAIELFTKPATIQDTFNLINSIVKPFERTIAGLMETAEIQDIMLEKLGATEETWKEAREQHGKEKEEYSKKQQEEVKKLFADAAEKKKIDPKILERIEKVSSEKKEGK